MTYFTFAGLIIIITMYSLVRYGLVSAKNSSWGDIAGDVFFVAGLAVSRINRLLLQ